MPLQIYKRGQTWWCRGTIAGRLIRRSCGTAERKIAERVAAKVQEDAWKNHLDGPSAVLTFAQASMMYRAADKESRYLAAIEDYWKDTLVKDITDGAIIQSALELLPNVKPATRNRNVIAPTRAIINHCAQHKLCQRITVQQFKAAKVVRQYATIEWVEAFMAHAEPHLGALALFMFVTGARISEAIRLRWEDVDFERRVMLIREEKTGNPSEAHIPPALMVALGNITRREASRGVFWYASRDGAKNPWRAAIQRAGIRPLSFHTARHGFATALLRQGIDVVTIAKLGRWRSPEHVFRTYGHAMEDITVTDRIAGTPQKIETDNEITPYQNRTRRG